MKREKPKRGSVVPDNSCPSCGTLMKPSKKALGFPVNGEELKVPGVQHLRCPSCGEALIGLEAARKIRVRAIEAYRKKFALLSAREILELREALGLPQKAMAQILRLGETTISRWESGQKVQTAALDALLRLVRDVPGNLDYLKQRAA